ncbi:tyrosine-protein kinase receptor TYRO3-like [Scleropages formosus]|uniref:Tyrosine-protein kinase receptor TYRO3-like n=1 Tax=Scleropages formosus TaxID=113540 RepID=A0A0N8JXW0_SCLFO|nr:tyrosine-protein kinase receptor TYRO3-like [Scleropages formosus]
MSKNSGKRLELPEHRVMVPPFQQVIGGLRCYSNYSVRICCSNEVGTSPFSSWVDFQTPEAVPSAAPRNLTFDLSEQQLSLNWAALEESELHGRLQAYKVQWNLGGENQEALLFKENKAHLSGGGRFFNATFQVSACTAVGCGPWSQPVLVMPAATVSSQGQRSHIWVGLLLGLLVATMVGVLLTVLVHHRGKETQYGSAFEPSGAETRVSFTAARSFNRQGPALPESTCKWAHQDNDARNTRVQRLLADVQHLSPSSGHPGYEIMHSCWSPVPKCRPSFQQLIDQLESAWAGLSPGPDQEPLLYVNLEGDGDEKGAGQAAGSLNPEEPQWSVPWQCVGMEKDEKDWLMVTSGATLAISGDYRYIIGPSSTAEEEGNPAGISGENIQEDVKEEDDDVVIDV